MRKRHGGDLIHSSRDAHGPLEVVDEKFWRSLHFGTAPRQSSMRLDDPIPLVLGYTRAMMTALLFNPRPRSALIIGLGGGSLAKFLLHHFPQCRIDAVELRESVVRLAHAWFALPEDPRLAVHIDDAARFIQGPDARGDYDLLLVDAFHHQGMDTTVSESAFLGACRDLLLPEGVLAINLWSDQKSATRATLRTLAGHFGGHALRLPVPGKGNVVGLGPATPVPARRLRDYDARAESMDEGLGLELPLLLRELRKANRSWLGR